MAVSAQQAAAESSRFSAAQLQQLDQYWREHIRLVTILMVIWAVVSFGAMFIVKVLNQFHILTGFPLGYYMGSQGSITVFWILIFVYARQMDKLDRKYRVEE